VEDAVTQQRLSRSPVARAVQQNVRLLTANEIMRRLLTVSLCGLVFGHLPSKSSAAERLPDSLESYPKSHPSISVERTDNDSDVVGFGHWSNVQVSKSEDPHALGMDIQIWKQKDHLVGYLQEYVGPAADPPIGKLENIQFNEQTRQISFSAKLSLGSVYSDANQKWVPAKNFYLFEGSIKDFVMAGVLEKKLIQDNGQTISQKENVEFKGSLGGDEVWENKPYREWLAFYERLMKERGPKW
jgi:hypothetical protein